MSKRTFQPVIALLTTGLVLGCGNDSPTGVESPAVAPSSPPMASNSGQPLQTGMLRAEFPGSICGIDVMIAFFRAGASSEPAGPGGPPARENGTVRITYTNPANGKVLQFRNAGRTTREITSVREDGSFTVVETILGLRAQSQVPNGPVLQEFDAGRLVVELLVTPLPGSGFDVQLLDVRFSAGPKRGTLFESPEQCAIVTDALT